MKMEGPTLTIETSLHGLNRLIIHVDRQDSTKGFVLLQKVLPVLRELDQLSRDPLAERKGGEK